MPTLLNKTMTNNNRENPFAVERSQIVDGVFSEFVGPTNGEENITENPVTRYSAGMIFPNHYESRRDKPEESEINEKDDTDAAGDADIGDSDKGSANSFFPSVMGISFYCSGNSPDLKVEVGWTVYNKLETGQHFIKVDKIPESIAVLEEFKENFEFKDGKLYARGVVNYGIPKQISEIADEKDFIAQLYKVVRQSQGEWQGKKDTAIISVRNDFKSQRITEGLELVCERRFSSKDNLTLITLALKNTNLAGPDGMDEEHVFFNVSITATSAGSQKEIFTEYSSIPLFKHDEEELSLALLYKNRKTYAVGHGCSANWKCEDGATNSYSVYTEAIPSFEIPKTDFDIPGLDPSILSMKELSGIGTLKEEEIVSKLKVFCNLYKQWINGLKTNSSLPVKYSETIDKHIRLCEESYTRMTEGLQLLATDGLIMESFQLANKAMLMQSFHSELQKQKRSPGENTIEWPDYLSEKAGRRGWRPFQLGFLLLSLKGITEHKSSDREIVDLIWFPTGGGKTEAYLGLSSFTIFYRRLKYPNESGGTAVIMRYTLRLLTAQQFQRACTLICAMEKMRQDSHGKLGDEEISVGLWVGIDSTPNSLEMAEKGFQEYIFGETDKNPSPLLSCPWCGTKTVVEKPNGNRECGYKSKSGPKQANLFCLEPTCAFSQRLPVLIVDEEIYRDPPTLLFGTVDKFAQMPLQKGISRVFASDSGNHNMPPELIIQDELHLISGALGTMVGLYETAIDFLCSRKGVRPKIIASTATIRRAADQCKNLFDRETRQFPSPGVDISDSFFSKEVPLSISPGRLYLGIMPSGKTQTTAAVRLTAELLHSVFTIQEEEDVKDKYWTIVSYFNSIRELGGFISLLTDDIPLYANALKQRYGGQMRDIAVSKELTSRKRAEEIPEILEQLSVGLPNRNAIDVLAATNMLSVGVDIDRLDLMVIRGQPKLTSEYIQVSSRIGRRFPGLVITLYNSARTRDRAHYERFRTYHETFYRSVEPSSVTPFSAPARARALSAVLVAMFRHGLGLNFEEEGGAALFTPELPGITELRDYIIQRVKDVDSTEADSTLEEFEMLIGKWFSFIKENEGKVVYKNEKMGNPIARRAGDFGKGLWEFPTSMRNVDAECNIDIKDD